MGGNPVRVSLHFLRIRSSTSDIYKINEGLYCSAVAPKHSSKNIPGRHADNGQVSPGIDLSSRHWDPPPENLGSALNLKKSVLEPSPKIEFLGMVIDSTKMEISLPQEKLVKLMPQCK